MGEELVAAGDRASIDPAEFVPDVDEDSLDDEFTSMSTETSMHCSGQPPDLTPSATRYLVLTWPDDDPEAPPDAFAPAPPDLMARIDASVRIVGNYTPFPMREVETTPEGAGLLRQWSFVSSVLPALGNLESSRRIATGLHYLSRVAEIQRTNGELAAFAGIDFDANIGYPVLTTAPDGRWQVAVDDSKNWPTASAALPIVNMSLGPRSAAYPYLPNDLVNLATLCASAEMLVVLASGNCGELGMSPWAQAPWVLGVGATADEEGTRLASYSGRGSADGTTPGPDLVAWGTRVTDAGKELHGTSFAAPRVSFCARLVFAAFLQLGHHVLVAQGGPTYGVPLVGCCWIDEGYDTWKPSYQVADMPALPVIGMEQEMVRRLVEVTKAAATPLNLASMNVRVLRDFLISAATPIPGYGPHEVGAGFIDIPQVIRRLASVTGLDLVQWFADPPVDPAMLPTPVRDDLASIRVFAEDELWTLCWLVQSTGPLYFYDWRRKRTWFTPLGTDPDSIDDLDARLSGLRLD